MLSMACLSSSILVSEASVIATGFLRLGTWDDEPNDPSEYQYERLEDMVHATTTAFLAMTVKCARCHDHKFDAIPQTDELGFAAETNKVHVHDLHATILHLMGLDHTRLTYFHQGRDERLTDVYGNVVTAILA